MPTPLLGSSEADLRRDRTSVKWVAYPSDVLPLWVAEMDVAPCPAVVEAVSAAVRRGDTGYGWSPRYAAAVARYASDAWGWEIDASAAMIVPDVMIGAAELLRLLTDAGGPVVVSPPVYDSFFGFVDAIGRRRLDAPLTPDGRLDRRRCGRRSARRPREVSGRHTCCATRTTPRARSTPPPSWPPWRRWPRSTASGSSPTRSTPRSSTPADRPSPPTSACRGESAASRCSRRRRGGTSPG